VGSACIAIARRILAQGVKRGGAGDLAICGRRPAPLSVRILALFCDGSTRRLVGGQVGRALVIVGAAGR